MNKILQLNLQTRIVGCVVRGLLSLGVMLLIFVVLIKSGGMIPAGLISWPELTLFPPLRISQKASSVWPSVVGRVSNPGKERWLSFMMLTMYEWSCSRMVEEGVAWRVIILVRLLRCKIVKKLCWLSRVIRICGLSQMSMFSVDSGYIVQIHG